MTAKTTIKNKSKVSKKPKVTKHVHIDENPVLESTTKSDPVVETVQEPSPAQAPVSTPASTPAPTPASTPIQVSTPVSVIEPDPTSTVTVTPDVDSTDHTDDLVDTFKSVCSNLNIVLGSVKILVADVKKLEKKVQRELKEARKNRKKNKSGGSQDKPKRAPSGFAKPSDISEELCVFLGRPFGTQMARTEVTKFVTQYIKDQGLQNPVNKRHILPDQKLGALLGANDEEEVTYFNLQKYMKHHFPKSASAKVAELAEANEVTD